jgi:hypothetical protein
MCIQCMMGAMTAGAGATGARSFLAARRPAWMSARSLRAVTVVLVVAALLASTVVLGGSS